MKALAAYITRGHLSAALVAVAAAAAALFFAPLGYVSGAAVALMTLVAGPTSGLVVVAIAAGVTMLVGLAAVGEIAIGVGFAVAIWLPAWLVASVLRQTVSLPMAVMTAAGLGVLLILGIHAFVADPAALWEGQLQQVFSALEQQGGGLDPSAEEAMRALAGVMTGALGAGVALSLALTLFLARWLQAMLQKPGGFRAEFHSLRLDDRLAWVALAIAVGGAVAPGGAGVVAGHLTLVLVVLYLLQGIAVVHGTAGARGLGWQWLALLYALLLLVPYTIPVVAALGFLDTWLDVRRRLAPSGDGPQDG
ncbi:Predicted membrane protein [Thiohalospira halophila DSM 15071]|uniref:Predicted membrane protein n=1 Tax=Thiohalospira halophila DSM 15071 TaxID=1123397 RepID=A0A1I1UFE2_9GAMM|nr:DUF2232 domain-containing protein [Thiohalospira halophila]SFD69562.1 Predicted membrane protein [Thiohalospira halophila DSM 15071]